MVQSIGNHLQKDGWNTEIHLEGDAYSPLDLCWTAYLCPEEYYELLNRFPHDKTLFSEQLIHSGEYVLLRYRVDRIPLYEETVDAWLHQREFCYNPANTLPLSKFTDVFYDLWFKYAETCNNNLDYAIFDASLVSHMTNDLMRNYHARPVELAKHLNKLLNAVCELQPIVFYLYSDDVEKRVTEARIARKQQPLGERSIQFWKERATVDQAVLPMLQVETHWLDISKGQWDTRLFEILDQIGAK